MQILQSLGMYMGHIYENYFYKAIISVAIFLMFLMFRKFFVKYIFRILLKISSKTKTDVDDYLLKAFEKPTKIFFIYMGVYISLTYFLENPRLESFISQIFRSIIVILIAIGFYNFAGYHCLLSHELEERFNIKIDKILVPFFTNIIRIIIVILALTIIVEEFGYNIQSMITGLGIGGLAVALAAKDILSNILSGVIIILDKPFSIGDWIKTNAVEGTVEDINFRSTKIRSFDKSIVIVPNSMLSEQAIINFTRRGVRRVTFKLGLTYRTPKDKLERCVEKIESMLKNHPDVNKETIFTKFDGFNESSLDIFIYFFTDTSNWEDYLSIKQDTNFKIMDILEKEGAKVAFPSTSIYFEDELDVSSKNLEQESK